MLVDIPVRVRIPFSEDGIHVHMATYKVIRMVLHLGKGHEAGHYVAIHCLDKLTGMLMMSNIHSLFPMCVMRTSNKLYKFGSP